VNRNNLANKSRG